tara:strand:+ start:1273 stop:2184 length:912 start_codon:yes stop_codon:yes gene_type:complete
MKTVVIFGGSGFVGQHIIRRIVKKGYKIIVPYQHQVDEPKIRLLGTIGQVIPIRFFSIDDPIIKKQINKSEIIINLKTMWDVKKKTYEEGILGFNRKLSDYIKKNNENCQFIYFSGLGVNKDAGSKRSKSIFESENYFQQNLKNIVIIRPGVIIGGGDNFLKNLLPLFKISLFIPLFGKGNSKFQPVYIDDVSKAVSEIISESLEGFHLFEFFGNKIFSYKEFYYLISLYLRKKRYFIPIPIVFVKLIVFFLEKISLSPLKMEQLKLFEKDNIAQNKGKNLQNLNIMAQDLDEILKNIILKNN